MVFPSMIKRSIFASLSLAGITVFIISIVGNNGHAQINNLPIFSIPYGSLAPSLPCNSQTKSSAYYQMPSTNQIWMCDGTNWNIVLGQVGPQGPAGSNGSTYLSGTTGVITGTLLAIGGYDSGNASVSGAVPGEPCVASTTDGSNPSSSLVISCMVTATNTATVSLTALVIGTPGNKSYNVRVYP